MYLFISIVVLKIDNFFILQFICQPSDMPKVRTNLDKFNYDIVHAEEEHIALQRVTLSELEFDHICKFINNVQGLQDIVHVYDNIA